MSFEETELRLGLPGNNDNDNNNNVIIIRKRGFNEEADDDQQTILTVMPDLKLNLTSSPKEEVVGWPPISCCRKKRLGLQKGSKEEECDEDQKKNVMKKKIRFVKVSLDGAPYLRKVDLTMYNSYNQLSHALAKFFGAFTIGKCGSEAGGMKELMNELKVNVDCSDYVPTYQDIDGDWMLLGDVPWQMFVESCNRVRIMKGKEAIGIAPRAVEKYCKNNNNKT